MESRCIIFIAGKFLQNSYDGTRWCRLVVSKEGQGFLYTRRNYMIWFELSILYNIDGYGMATTINNIYFC